MSFFLFVGSSRVFFSLSWGLLEFWWCFGRLGPSNVRVFALGLSCEREREKKSEILGGPAEGGSAEGGPAKRRSSGPHTTHTNTHTPTHTHTNTAHTHQQTHTNTLTPSGLTRSGPTRSGLTRSLGLGLTRSGQTRSGPKSVGPKSVIAGRACSHVLRQSFRQLARFVLGRCQAQVDDRDWARSQWVT